MEIATFGRPRRQFVLTSDPPPPPRFIRILYPMSSLCCWSSEFALSVSDFQSISLYPRQTSYTITQGSPWQLTIRAFGGSRCEFVYTPKANRNTPFAHVTSKGSLQITVADDVTGRFEEEVMVRDPCGGEVSRVYDVTIKERPPTEGRFITDKQINCDGRIFTDRIIAIPSRINNMRTSMTK